MKVNAITCCLLEISSGGQEQSSATEITARSKLLEAGVDSALRKGSSCQGTSLFYLCGVSMGM